MATVRVTQLCPGTVTDAERAWYDTTRWPRWVDGLSQTDSVDPGWPEAGAVVIWESGPAGRGRVTERVISYEPLRGQTVEVQDGSIEGRQTVLFTPEGDGVEVALALEYRLRRRSPLMPLVDLLFIRRAMARSLQSTLNRFATEVEGTLRR
jgi:hypothetical protein